jgi:hypothetical protein
MNRRARTYDRSSVSNNRIYKIHLKESEMNKLVIASVAASVMLVSFSASQAANPAAGPSEMSAGAPAALCGPSYTVKHVTYAGPNGGVVKSYRCERTIADARPCNKSMQRKDDDLKLTGNSLKLGYVCFLPEG